MAGMFQINPRTGKPYTVDEAMAVGMPQQGVMQQQPMQQPMQGGTQQQQMEQRKEIAGGMFGQAAKPKGSGWWDVLGTIGDVMSGVGGGQPVYWGTKMAEKQKADAWAQELEKINEMAAARAQYATPKDTDTPLMRNIAYLRTLNPKLTDQEAFDIAQKNLNRPFAFGNDLIGFTGAQSEQGGAALEPVPPGVPVSPEVWSAMPPEDRALFQR